MKEFKYKITEPQGIHARPAGELIRIVKQFACTVTIAKDGKSADAKKIFGVMGLAAKQGDEITMTFEGVDEVEAQAAVEAFLKENL
ncbi:MAG: HPr family phosphocarrier protein [Lachnospiraceae bacterium]|nr:HPr family phosphocarrier protein [Lachnospiraceae bacterium]